MADLLSLWFRKQSFKSTIKFLSAGSVFTPVDWSSPVDPKGKLISKPKPQNKASEQGLSLSTKHILNVLEKTR